MPTTGTAKTATLGKQIASSTTEDGSGFYNIDTTAGALTTTLVEVAVGQQERFKQANGSWAVNPWTLQTISGGPSLKYLNAAGVSVTATSLALSSRSIGEVIAEFDGTYIQVTMLQQALGGVKTTTPPLTISTVNTIPALPAAWNGFDEPTLTIGGNVVPHQAGAATTAAAATSASTSVTVASGTNIAAGQAVSGAGVTAGTLVAPSYVPGSTTVPLTLPATIANAAALTFASAVTFTAGSTSVAVNQYALGYNVNPGDSVFATFAN